MNQSMKFVSAITTEDRNPDKLCQMLIAQIRLELGDLDPNFVMVLFSPHFTRHASDIAKQLHTALAPDVLIGCSGESIIGATVEVEQKTAISVIAAYLPDVTLTAFRMQPQNWGRSLNVERAFYRAVNLPGDSKLVVMLADPFSTPMDKVLDAFNRYYTDLPITGGMASGSYQAGGNAIILNDTVSSSGLVGVAFSGSLDVDVIVSQGCRPVGEPVTVSAAQENVILKLNNEVPVHYLKEMIGGLSDEEQELLQNGLFIGRIINPEQRDIESLGRGDFLIRGVMGVDQRNGALVVGDYLEKGETIQFHVRDASTAEEDLEMMLTPQLFYDAPAGGMLFSCNGRGTKLYDHPNGDISIVQKVIPDLSVAGFFCAGEIGPVGSRNFLHGHTASLALFRSSLPTIPTDKQPFDGLDDDDDDDKDDRDDKNRWDDSPFDDGPYPDDDDDGPPPALVM